MPKPYDKKGSLSQCFGVFPCLELLEHKPESITEIYYSNHGRNNSGLQRLLKEAQRLRIRTQENTGLINKLTESQNSFVVCYFKKYTSQISKESNHLILDQIRDTGNLGQIVRTAIAFDFNNIAIIRPAVDIFDPRTVRASMGSCFQLNFQFFDRIEDYQKQFSTHKLYSFMTDGRESFTSFKPQTPYSLIFGNESAGLDNSFRRISSTVVIPFNSKAVDSLNLNSAVSIVLGSLFSLKD